MAFASSVRFHGANFAKLCGLGSNLWDRRNHRTDSQVFLANRLMNGAAMVSKVGGRLTGFTGTNLLLRKPSLGFRLVFQSGDDQSEEELSSHNLNSLWHLVKAAKEELKHAKEIRSMLEVTIDRTSPVDMITLEEAVEWEHNASKRLDDAMKAMERLEDLYFGNM